LGSIRDISGRIESQEKLNSSEVTFKAIWENSLDGMRLTDDDGIIYLCNQSFASLVGKKAEELIGQPISVLHHPDESEKVMSEYNSNFINDNIIKRVEASLKLWNGDEIEVDITNSIIHDLDKKKFLLSIFRDITQKKSSSEIIKKKDRLLQGIAEATKQLISSKEYETGFPEALCILGAAAEVDRVYIYQHQVSEITQEMYFSLLHEWASDDVEHQIESPAFQKISYSRFSSLNFYENFSIGNVLKFVIKDLPIEIREEFIDKKIRSIILVPIMIDDSYWGFVGFDEVKTDRIWTDDEESILVIMASTLGAVIKSNHFKKDLINKNEELDKSVKVAEQLSQVKSEFLALMSHEIRTPLNGVMGMADLLFDTNLDDNQKEYARTIKLSGEQLLSVINNILEFSKIESDKLELEKEPFDLRECIEDSLDLLSLKASEKELELIYSIDPETPRGFLGDVIRLRQILTNLISNGIKFTDNGEIYVSVKSKKIQNNYYELLFCVKDTGIGIPVEKMNKLFKSFSQIDSSDSHSYGGTGLGLVICKKLAEMMKGKMWVESEPEIGTSFYFTICTESISSDTEFDNYEILSLFEKKKILYLSSNNTLLEVVKNQFINWGMISISASDEKEAFEILESENPPEIILIDNNLTPEKAKDLINRIRNNVVFAKVPIIMMVPFGKTIEELYQLESADLRLIPKPLKFSLLHYALKEQLGNSTFNDFESDEKQNYYSVSEAEKKIIKILFVEDNEINQRIGLKVIQRAGYDADVVSSRLEILEAIKNNLYHIVLMDSSIPETNIIEIAGQIKGKNGLPKIIVITDDLDNNQIKSFEENGITDFIQKPLRYYEVEALLNNLTCKINEERKEEFQFEVKRESDITIINVESITSLFDLQIKSDVEFFIDLLGIYLRDLPFMTKVIDNAIKNKDFKRLKFYTHKLEGSILNLGIENVVDVCHQLEKAAKKNLMDESVISLNFELQKIMHKVFSEISALREKYININ
jgi:PAS domain S-box-containing protein